MDFINSSIICDNEDENNSNVLYTDIELYINENNIRQQSKSLSNSSSVNYTSNIDNIDNIDDISLNINEIIKPNNTRKENMLSYYANKIMKSPPSTKLQQTILYPESPEKNIQLTSKQKRYIQDRRDSVFSSIISPSLTNVSINTNNYKRISEIEAKKLELLENLSITKKKINNSLFIINTKYDGVCYKYNIISLSIMIISTITTFIEAVRLTLIEFLKNNNISLSIVTIDGFTLIINILTLTLGTVVTILSTIVRFKNYREIMEKLKNTQSTLNKYKHIYEKQEKEILIYFDCNCKENDACFDIQKYEFFKNKIEEYNREIKEINIYEEISNKKLIELNKIRADYDNSLKKIKAYKELEEQKIENKNNIELLKLDIENELSLYKLRTKKEINMSKINNETIKIISVINNESENIKQNIKNNIQDRLIKDIKSKNDIVNEKDKKNEEDDDNINDEYDNKC